jgi:hypothetical protein
MVYPFVFVYPDSISDLAFVLEIGDQRGILDSFTFHVLDLRGPPIVNFSPSIEGIELTWSPILTDGDLGFFIYRSQDSLTGFVRLNRDPVSTVYYLDLDIEPAQTYYYYITLVDTNWNESSPSSTIGAYSSPALLPGWPQFTSSSESSPLVADIIKGNDGLEIVVGGRDGTVHLFDHQGNLMPGWPVYVGGEVHGSPAAGDIDSDGKLEIVVAPWDTDSNYVYAFEGDGSIVNGWPRPIPSGDGEADRGVYAPPVIADLDLDGVPEVIVKTVAGLIYVWRGNGEGFLDSTGFFFDLGRHFYSLGALAVGDVDGSGDLEIVAGTGDGVLHVLKTDATELPGFPITGFQDILAPVVLGDIDPDLPGLEIVVLTKDSLRIFDSSGNQLPGFPTRVPLPDGFWFSTPALADVDGDGNIDVILNHKNGFNVYDKTGSFLFSTSFNGGFATGVVAVDLNEDGSMELFTGSIMDGFIGVKGVTGENIKGFPIPIHGTMSNTPAIADVNSDGLLDLVIQDDEGGLFVFSLDATYDLSSTYFPWPAHMHDIQRTGCYNTPQTGLSVEEPTKGIALKKSTPRLLPIAPNIFNKGVAISFVLPEKSRVDLKIYNVAGRLVKQLIGDVLPAGIHRIEWSGGDEKGRRVPSGVYFVTLKVGDHISRKKILKLTR